MAAKIKARIIARESEGKLYWGCSLCGDLKKQITFYDSNKPTCNFCDKCGEKFLK